MARPYPRRIAPRPGQESVWDYPRPPRVDPTGELVEVRLAGEIVARSRRSVRVLETSHPPVYYLPLGDFADGALVDADGASWCEYKGRAAYYDVRSLDVVASRAAWTYPAPSRGFEALAGMVAVYPGRMDSCTVNGEPVRPQPGDFYGGWITDRIVGPFKGDPGTSGW